MDLDYGKKYVDSEKDNWWCVQRRNAIFSLVSTMPRDSRILEIGCSSGLLVDLLVKNGFVNSQGCDLNPDAIKVGRGRNLNLFVCDASNIKSSSTYDVVIASDILEHLEDDVSALSHWFSLLKPGGRLIVFVPAFQKLWSKHDEINHHYRRYSVNGLSSAGEKAGFKVERSGYWNFLLFFPVFLLRFGLKSRQSSAFEGGRGAVNAFLSNLLGVENAFFSKGVDFPVGVSCFAILRKG